MRYKETEEIEELFGSAFGIDLHVAPGTDASATAAFLVRSEQLDELLQTVHAGLIEEPPARVLKPHAPSPVNEVVES